MKRIIKILIKSLLGLLLLILILLFTVPVLFKEKIKTKVEEVINGSVNATVTFSDYNLSFFRNFPNLSFSLKGLSVVGKGEFEGDTLAGLRSFDFVFNLGSLLGSSGYEVKSIIVNRAVVNAIVHKDGKANWDIAFPSDTTATIPPPEQVVAETTGPESGTEGGEEGGGLKILLRKFEIKKSQISYIDSSMNLNASIQDFNFVLSGNMTLSETELKIDIETGPVTVEMDGVRYLNRAVIESRTSLAADLDNMSFTFDKNYFGINDLRLNFSGTVSMPGDDIATDISFGTDQTSFKTLLSLVPAVYMTGYEDLEASGAFALAGTAKGLYSDADSTLPDIKLNLSVSDGLISYPDLPENISNVNINTEVSVDGKDLDKTTVNLDKFHFELAGSPFDMSFFLKTPMSDPDFRGSVNGKIDLGALSHAVPMDSLNLSGVIEMAVSMAGRLSFLENEDYESFSARGTMTISDMVAEMAGYPKIDIREASFLFTPAFTQMQKVDVLVEETSDFTLSGNVENYIPYVFKNGTVKGNLTLYSKMVDATAIMNAMAVDTTVETVTEDTLALAVIAVPKNIDFDFSALIENFKYDNITADNINGHIIVRDGVLSVRETGLAILGGSIVMNADYDTRDTLKPVMSADFNMKNIAVKDAYNTFVAIRKFAPVASGINGNISMQLNYKSLLGSDMMPVLETIDGYGKLQSDEIQLVESATFDKIKDVLKLGDKYSNTFRDINISFKINDGRVFVDPFNLKLGNIRMNIGGDQGLDQTLNYLVKTEIPRSELGGSVNSLIDNLSTQASAFGLAFKPSDVLKVNVRVRGTFTKPEVSPDFGSGGSTTGASTLKETAKETVQQTIGDAVDKGKEELRKEAEIQGDKLIKEAEDRGQQLREEAAKAAEKIRQEAEVQAQNLIKAADSKGAIAKAAAQRGATSLRSEADKRAEQLIREADNQAIRLVEEAKAKKEDMISKI